MNTISAQLSSLTAEELASAESYLAKTRDTLLATVDGLSEAQWNFKPSAECWSIAEILEHVALVEARVHARIAGMADAPEAEPDRMDSKLDEMIVAQVPDRSVRVQASPIVLPSHGWTPEESVAHFVDDRHQTLELLGEAPFLRGRVLPHPIFGNMDGYQWILAAAAHTARHTAQIVEIKSALHVVDLQPGR